MTKVTVNRIQFHPKLRLTYFQRGDRGGQKKQRKGLKQLISLKAIINYGSNHVCQR